MELNFNLDDIKGFKLLNGSDIIAKLVEETDRDYVLENAVFWDLMQVDERKYDVHFSPLSAGIKMAPDATHPAISVNLPKISVLFPYEVRDEITGRYKQLISPIALIV